MSPPSFTPASHALLGLAPRPPGALSIAFVVPMQGPTGIYGPGCLACGELAADELNAGGGIAGKPVELVAIDAGRAPHEVAAEVARLVELGRVDAIAGWHISAVRQAITARVGGRALYAFAAMHEGGDDTPGVFMIGERPVNQLLPATAWMRANHGVSRWAVVGNDYVFPRVTGSTARMALRGSPSKVVSETYVPLGTRDFAGVLRGLEGGEQDGVIMLLMGQDAVHFNRQFAAAGLSSSLTRLSPAVEENTLLAGGAGANVNVFAAAAYFDGLTTPESAGLAERYYRRFGEYAPSLNAVGESCYESLMFLRQIGDACGSLEVDPALRLTDHHSYSSPRGLMRMHGNLVDQDVYIAAADGLRFEIQEQIAYAS